MITDKLRSIPMTVIQMSVGFKLFANFRPEQLNILEGGSVTIIENIPFIFKSVFELMALYCCCLIYIVYNNIMVASYHPPSRSGRCLQYF